MACEPGPARAVEFLLLAEFNILTGSTVKHQYPRRIGVDDQMLAEFMLPDGAHKREDDCTVFFLNRPGQVGTLRDSTWAEPLRDKSPKGSSSTPPPPPVSPRTPRNFPFLEAFIYKYAQARSQDGWVPEGTLPGGKQRRLRVILSVPMRIVDGDREVARIERHEYLTVMKLEDMFLGVPDTPDTAVGVRLSTPADEAAFQSHVDRMLEGDPDWLRSFSEDGPAPQQQQQQRQGQGQGQAKKKEAPREPYEGAKFLYCLTLVRNRLDATVTRGSELKSLTICTRCHYVDVFKPLLLLQLDKYFKRQSEDVLAELYDALNSLDLSSVPALPDHQRMTLRNSTKAKERTSVLQLAVPGSDPRGQPAKLNVYVPLTTFPDEVGDVKVMPLVQKFGRQIMVVYNAILLEKRVVFLGFNCTAAEVCNYVLAAVAMLCPPLKGVVTRAFPYTNLCYLDFLATNGYITGAMNPMFEEKSEWWDVLCNIQTGKVMVNPKLGVFPEASCSDPDNELMDALERTMQAHYGEDRLRSLFHSYTQRIADIASGDAVYADDADETRAINAHGARVLQWKTTESFAQYARSRETRLAQSALKSPEVARYVRMLKTRRSVAEADMTRMYDAFLESVATPQQLDEFLSFFPEADGGLFPVAVGLFHTSDRVRSSTIELFRRLDSHKTGKEFLSGMNMFLAMAYHRALEQQRVAKANSERAGQMPHAYLRASMLLTAEQLRAASQQYSSNRATLSPCTCTSLAAPMHARVPSAPFLLAQPAQPAPRPPAVASPPSVPVPPIVVDVPPPAVSPDSASPRSASPRRPLPVPSAAIKAKPPPPVMPPRARPPPPPAHAFCCCT
eukprot:m51a1_g1600 hypothetical protein (842) ;mRNA; r:168490-171977